VFKRWIINALRKYRGIKLNPEGDLEWFPTSSDLLHLLGILENNRFLENHILFPKSDAHESQNMAYLYELLAKYNISQEEKYIPKGTYFYNKIRLEIVPNQFNYREKRKCFCGLDYCNHCEDCFRRFF
jgi:hypothetical protein